MKTFDLKQHTATLEEARRSLQVLCDEHRLAILKDAHEWIDLIVAAHWEEKDSEVAEILAFNLGKSRGEGFVAGWAQGKQHLAEMLRNAIHEGDMLGAAEIINAHLAEDDEHRIIFEPAGEESEEEHHG